MPMSRITSVKLLCTMNFTYVLLLTVDFEFVAGVFTLNDVTLLVIVLDFS